MGNIVNNPTPTGNQINITDYQELAERDEKSYFGMAEITLSNYDNDNEPEILNGSMYDIDNSVFVESSDLSITGWSGISNDTDTYIKAVVSGSGNSSTTAFEFTDTVPTWSQTKGGWYDGIDRYFFYLYKDGSGNYTDKKKLVDQNNYWFPNDVAIAGTAKGEGLHDPLKFKAEFRDSTPTETSINLKTKIIEIGSWNMRASAGGTATKTFAHNVSRGDIIGIIDVLILSDTGDPDQLSRANTSGVVAGGVQDITSTNIVLQRVSGQHFDGTSYQSAIVNRGQVTLLLK